jgi:hypothetical protein
MKRILLAVVAAIGLVSTSFEFEPLVRYSGEVNIGFASGDKLMYGDDLALDTSLSRPFLETIHGVAIGQHLFVGAGIGIQGYLGAWDLEYPDEKWKTITLPMYVNVKGMLPMATLSPYVSVSLGGSIVPYSGSDISISIKEYSFSTRLKGGFYCDVGLGVNILKWLNVCAGMQHQRFGYKFVISDSYFPESDNDDGYNGTSWYLKVGFSW